MAITIIGLPVAWQTFKIGLLCLWPFGSEVRSNLMLSGIANVALIPRILDVGSLRGFYEDKLQSLHFAQFIPMNSALMTWVVDTIIRARVLPRSEVMLWPLFIRCPLDDVRWYHPICLKANDEKGDEGNDYIKGFLAIAVLFLSFCHNMIMEIASCSLKRYKITVFPVDSQILLQFSVSS